MATWRARQRLGVRQSSGALATTDLRAKSGRGLPQSKTSRMVRAARGDDGVDQDLQGIEMKNAPFLEVLIQSAPNLKVAVFGLALGFLISSCSQKNDSEMTDSGFTKGEIHEFTSMVSQKTTNSITGFSREPNGDVTVSTQAEMFVLHSNTNGWVIVHRAETRWR